MIGTPINQVRRVINQGLIKDLISPLLYCEAWLLVGVVAQWQSTGTESQRPWVRFPAAPPFFPALSPFQRSTDSNGEIRSLIRPWLITLRT